MTRAKTAAAAPRTSFPTWPVRRVSRVQLRALRSLLARAEGVRRSQVRLTLRPDTAAGRTYRDPNHVELVVRVRYTNGGGDWWAVSWSAEEPRGVVGRVARRAWERDLP